MSVLKIIDLHVSIDDKEILHGVNLEIASGEIHAIMGPNGNGKSTLLSAIMGHPKYIVTQGSITLDDVNVLAMEVDERARAGLFLAMQYPQEISGVTNSDFMKAAINTRREKPIGLFQFARLLENSIEELQMSEDLAHRYLNVGFSGGEKKRNEILQMKLLEPKFALLDEVDSGLDIDALNIVAKTINSLKNDAFGCLIVSHYERLFELVKPSHVHVLLRGRIIMSGGYEIIQRIDNDGYRWLSEFAEDAKEEETDSRIILGNCAIKESTSG